MYTVEYGVRSKETDILSKETDIRACEERPNYNHGSGVTSRSSESQPA